MFVLVVSVFGHCLSLYLKDITAKYIFWVKVDNLRVQIKDFISNRT